MEWAEFRPIARPTSVRILDAFSTLRRHRLLQNGLLVQTCWDHVNPIHCQLLRLLEIPADSYGQ